MDLSAPLLDLAPTVRGALLQALARLGRPVTRRQLASEAGVSPGNASAVIGDLIATGLVSETLAGRSSMVELNRNHLAAAPVIALAGLRGELIHRLRDQLSTWSDLAGAWMFGSVARGNATAASDIDLLIVVDDLDSRDLQGHLTRLDQDIRSWTGNEVQIVEYSLASWRELVRGSNPLVDQIRRDGIALTADDNNLLARSR